MNKRLIKECRDILKSPIENIYTRPLEDNILQWHFILFPKCAPYNGGVYHGKLEFKTEYPMKPPSIIMYTPSGRFHVNERICLSMSDYHPETWNPSWGVETILIGLYSFMMEDECEGMIGSINDTNENRITFAKSSLDFNRSSKIFNELYDEYIKIDNIVIKQECDDNKFCRYCLEKEGTLINPCKCDGSNKWVHVNCLAKWQYSCILAQSTHPDYQTGIEEKCNVCQTNFNIIKYSRKNVMLEFTGTEIANMLEKGFYIISSKNSSECNEKQVKMLTNPTHINNIKHWIKSVYLITEIVPSDSSDGVHGVNLTRNINISEHSELYFNWLIYERYISNSRDLDIEHYIGGPCSEHEPYFITMIYSNMDNVCDLKSIGVSKVITIGNKTVIFGHMRAIIHILHQHYNMIIHNDSDKIFLNVVWGMAGWSRTQLLGEIAKGNWGMAKGYIQEIFPRRNQLWNILQGSSRAIYCGENDFSKNT